MSTKATKTNKENNQSMSATKRERPRPAKMSVAESAAAGDGSLSVGPLAAGFPRHRGRAMTQSTGLSLFLLAASTQTRFGIRGPAIGHITFSTLHRVLGRLSHCCNVVNNTTAVSAAPCVSVDAYFDCCKAVTSVLCDARWQSRVSHPCREGAIVKFSVVHFARRPSQ